MKNDGVDYNIINSSDTKLLVEIVFKEDYPYFDGHFEGFSILPALLQIDFAIKLGKKNLSFKNELKNTSNIKFSRPIYPKMKVSLELVWDKEKEELYFTYFDDDRTYSKGCLGG